MPNRYLIKIFDILRVCAQKSFSRGRGRRQETGDRKQETGDNPPLAPPPPRRGEMAWERGGRSKNCKNDFYAQLWA
ncbi:MAG: hypothetical protein F6K24_26855 [Okeania sp. SIO2D1]|nr:hypothetical protein [Okeania sp. SIO2D1]